MDDACSFCLADLLPRDNPVLYALLPGQLVIGAPVGPAEHLPAWELSQDFVFALKGAQGRPGQVVDIVPLADAEVGEFGVHGCRHVRRKGPGGCRPD